MATEIVTTFDAAGRLIAQVEVEIPATEANRRDISAQAAGALDANRTYLALTTPTNAQNLAQIRALTRQMQRVIRLALGLLDGTD